MDNGVLLFGPNGDVAVSKLKGNAKGAAYVSQATPPIAKWVAEGKVWQAIETTLQASVLAVPTTTAGVSFFNGEPESGKWYVILAALAIAGGTPAGLSSWGLVHQVSALASGTAIPTADLVTSTVVKNLLANKGVYGGAMVIDLALTVVDDRWAPIGDSINPSIISLTGTQKYIPLNPVVILPPNGLYSLEAVAAAVDVTTRMGIVWAEVMPDELM